MTEPPTPLRLVLALACTRPATAGPYEDADAAYARGDFAGALTIYRELAAQGVDLPVVQRHAVEQNAPAGGRHEARQQVDERGLARP